MWWRMNSYYNSMFIRRNEKQDTVRKNLVFYKVNEKEKIITIYAVVDQRQDYLNIIRGL